MGERARRTASPSGTATGTWRSSPYPCRQGHADGHPMGVALVFPRNVQPKERGRVLGKLFVDEGGGPCAVPLKLGSFGVWDRAETGLARPRGRLSPGWTAAATEAPQALGIGDTRGPGPLPEG